MIRLHGLLHEKLGEAVVVKPVQSFLHFTFRHARAVCAYGALALAPALAQEGSAAAFDPQEKINSVIATDTSAQDTLVVETPEATAVTTTLAQIRSPGKAKKKPIKKKTMRAANSPLGGAGGSSGAKEDGEGNDSNAANDPTTPRWTIENDNYPWFSKFSHRSAGYDGDVRIVAPWHIGEQGWLTRFNIPLLDTPRTATKTSEGGRIAGPSDISMYNWAIFKPTVLDHKITFGVGPMFTAPVGKVNSISEGKWQGGMTAVIVTAPSWGTAGAMFQWQKSFAGAHETKSVNSFGLQPFIYYNLPEHYYLRSSGVMSYDTVRKTAVVPVGFGIGKVFTYQDRIMNLWVEPQYSVVRRGQGQTRFQVYVGWKYLIPGTVNSLFGQK